MKYIKRSMLKIKVCLNNYDINTYTNQLDQAIYLIPKEFVLTIKLLETIPGIINK